MNYPLSMQIKFHFETFFNFGCIVLGCVGLVFYFRYNIHGSRFGTLPFYILTTILYGIFDGDNYFRQVLSVHGVKISIPVAYSWKVFVLIFPPSFTYVSGAMLALDRVLAMSCPVKHVTAKLSSKLTFLGVLICTTTTLLVFVSNAIVPASVELYSLWNINSITYKLYQGTHKFYEFVFLAEVILHIVFCIQFRLYRQKQGNVCLRLQTQRANQITLFLIITQSLLCLLPKIFFYSNRFFFGSEIQWMSDYHSYYSFFLSINVFTVNVFIVYSHPTHRVLSSCVAMNYSLDMQIKFHFETFFNFGCVILGCAGLVLYSRYGNHKSRFGTLPFYIVTTILYGIADGDNYFRQVLSVHGVKISIPVAYSWRVYFLILPPSFTYVSGAMLALDRVLAMSCPVKHVTAKLSSKLTFLGVLICTATIILLSVSNIIVPASVGLNATWNEDSISYKLYQGTHKFYEFVFLAEMIMHIIFCIQFRAYRRKQGNYVAKQQTQRANQITLFQIITQSLLCLLPKIFFYSNMFFFGSQVQWMRNYHSYYSFFLSINVFTVNVFIVYRFRPKKKTTAVQSLSANTGPTVPRFIPTTVVTVNC